MKCRVVYKKISAVQQAIVVVEEVFECVKFDVVEGALVLYGNDQTPMKAVPAGTWADCEALEEDTSSLLRN